MDHWAASGRRSPTLKPQRILSYEPDGPSFISKASASAIRKSAEVRFSQATLQRFNTSRDASYDALKRMTAAGLVHMAKSPGRSPVVTLLDADGRKLVVL